MQAESLMLRLRHCLPVVPERRFAVLGMGLGCVSIPLLLFCLSRAHLLPRAPFRAPKSLVTGLMWFDPDRQETLSMRKVCRGTR